MVSSRHCETGRRAALIGSILAMSLTSLVQAQLAPTGGHYAARASDTGFAGEVNSQGGYGASVPLDLPAVRGGLPLPVGIVSGGHTTGAAGLGWDVPLSFVRRDATLAHRRPMTIPDAGRAGTFLLGGEMPIHRLGFGAMRVTGAGVWGEPDDRASCLATLRRVPELGVNFIDTADSYGPAVSEPLLREALHPYPDDLAIATKGGQVRPGPIWS